MIKKIKILVSILILTSILLIANNSFAVLTRYDAKSSGLSYTLTHHTDSWSGKSEVMSQGGGDTAAGSVFCIKKGGALRATPAASSIAGYTTQEYIGHSDAGNHHGGNPVNAMINDVTNAIREELKDKLLGAGWGLAAVGDGIYAEYGEGNYSYTEHQLAGAQTPSNGDIIARTGAYSKTPTYQVESESEEANTYLSYILSSGNYFNPITGFGLKEGNYDKETKSDSADPQLIQDAIWTSAFNRGRLLTSPQVAMDLRKEAEEYEKYYKEELSKYDAYFDNTQAKVIADRNRQRYSVGPFRIIYPDDTRFSYIQDIYLVDENGNKIEANNFKVVTATGKIGNDGKEYPQSGEDFFVQFEGRIGDTYDRVDVKVEFAHLSLTQAKYTVYRGAGQVAQLVGIFHDRTEKHRVSWTDYVEEQQTHWTADGQQYTTTVRVPYQRGFDCTIHHFTGSIEERIIGSYDPQTLMVTATVKREWVEDYATSYAKADKMIDITTELGGFVWVDADGGKEGIPDGKYGNGEQRVPNVTVKLYREDGTFIAETKTDGNGEYRFEKLKAMYKYYVTFTYNGQYYEPTKFSPSSTWYDDEWFVNSNATDTVSERRALNDRFASIGANPANYDNSKETFTRSELESAGAIDKFGNNTGSGAMGQYVSDCLITAHTGNDTSYESYPVPDIFIIDNKLIKTAPGLIEKTVGEAVGVRNVVFEKSYYINLGLKERQESDLAVKKDVDHVTLEINGQKHTYTYDTLEEKIQQDDSWTIGVNVSDAFKKNYETSYVRELYKSDYLYKASNYGDAAMQAQLGKSKDDELEIYITYKIMVRNQALSIRARVDELVDYYDEDLEYVDDRSYIEIRRHDSEEEAQKGIYAVKADTRGLYNSGKTDEEIQNVIEEYNTLYITGLGSLIPTKESNARYRAAGLDNYIDSAADNLTNKESTELDRQNYLAAGQTAYVYLTFKVKKDTMDGEDWIKLDEEVQSGNPIGVGKENIAEINGYSTQYAKGTKRAQDEADISFNPAGIVDRDSNPGNVEKQINKKDIAQDSQEMLKLEDDTGKAPNIRIILYRDDDKNRVIAGNVFEDLRIESNDRDLTTTGNGIKDDEDTLINGVTVQLVELMDNGQEYVWREFGDNNAKSGQLGGVATVGQGTGSGTVSEETPIINMYNLVGNYKFAENHNGDYAFKSFMPGKYVIRFYYGDTVRTVVPTSLGGLNAKSYNGQDYKSTVYQKGINQNLQLASRDVNNWANTDTNLEYIWREKSTWNLNQEIPGAEKTRVSTFKQDASNNETARSTWSAAEQKGYLYDITASDAIPNVSDAKDIESRRLAVNDYSDNDVTNYIAEVLASHKVDYTTMTERNQLLNDLVQNTYMQAETGMMVIEVEYDTEGTAYAQESQGTYRIENVNLGLEERPKAQLAINKEITNVKLVLADGSTLFDASDTATNVLWQHHKPYTVGYKGNLMDADKFVSIERIREDNKNKFGFVQLTMDEELMHGATIQITYSIRVSNVGEVDYKDNLFYYTGEKSANAQIVKTRADQVIDYVANNLQFNANLNSNWQVIEKSVLQTGDERTALVHANLKDQVEEYNTIIETKNLNDELIPELAKQRGDSRNSSTTVPLVLSQLITSENDTDDLTYRNLVEIVKTSNTVGRRMEYSVVGNQDPTVAPQELDSDIAESVRILPPFGNAGRPMIIVAIVAVAAVLLVGGIIFIKKKVMRK